MSKGVHEARSANALVDAKLRRAWRKERRFHHVRGVCTLFLWMVALGTVDFMVDWLFLVPGLVRLALLASNLGILCWVVYRRWLRALNTFDPVRVALQVENRHPEFKNLLVSFVQLRHTDPATALASPSLIEAMKRQAVETTGQVDFREIVNFRELRRIFAICAVVFLLVGAGSVRWSDFFRVLFLRMLNPVSQRTYPTRTTIDAITGDLTAKQGDTVTLRVKGGGLVPAHAILNLKPEEGGWERIALPQTEENLFVYVFSEVFESFAYSVKLGDARSETYRVTIVPPPRIVSSEVTIAYPAYTQLGTEHADTLNLELIEGATVTWALTVEPALAAAETLTAPDRVSPLTLGEAGTRVTWTLAPTNAFGYRFRWTEKAHGYVYTEEVEHFVNVLPDAPPEIAILYPGQDEKATVEKTLTVDFAAHDDFGLCDVRIAYAVNGEEERKVPIGRFGRKRVQQEAVWKLRDTISGLKEGDVVSYAVEATDNRAGQPNTGQSPEQRLYIVSRDEYLRYALERKDMLSEQVRKLREEEERAAGSVKGLLRSDQ
ncbi:MAG: hypothetical protein JXR37_25520 [Kiritimatiellae bacterium]|nr:hypothetical protein [Kiritimatiellia bacterium]